MNNKVSIIIPTYNRAKLLLESVNSVLKQTNENWELLIVDDGSTDHTKDEILALSKNDDRVRYFDNKKTKGAQGARNTGVENSTGNFIIFLDSDDLLAEDCISKRLLFIQQNPDKDFYCFPTAIFFHQPYDSPLLWNYLNTDSDDLIRFLRQDMPFHTCGVIWKKESLVDLGMMDESLPCWQEWDLYVRALIHQFSYTKVADLKENIDSFFRSGDNAYSISKKTKHITHLNAITLLINKTVEQMIANDILDRSHKNEIVKLAARHSFQLIVHHEIIDETTLWFKSICEKINYPKLATSFWSVYLKNRFNKKLNPYLRKSLDFSKILGKSHIFKTKSTFGQASYQNRP